MEIKGYLWPIAPTIAGKAVYEVFLSELRYQNMLIGWYTIPEENFALQAEVAFAPRAYLGSIRTTSLLHGNWPRSGSRLSIFLISEELLLYFCFGIFMLLYLRRP